MSGSLYAQGNLITPAAAAAINVECGFYPDYVKILNRTDAEVEEASLQDALAFDGGGGTGLEIKPGDIIRGATGGWEAVVEEVVLASGTWPGGNAAGLLMLVKGSRTSGTITDNENIGVSRQKGLTPSGNYASVATGLLTGTLNIDDAVAAAAANAGITLYTGTSGDKSRGFTIGSALGGTGKRLFWQAWARGVG